MFSFRSYDALDIGMKNIDMKGTTSVFSERSKKKDRISSTYLNDNDLWPSICSSNVLFYKAIKASYFFDSRCINHEHHSFKSFH